MGICRDRMTRSGRAQFAATNRPDDLMDAIDAGEITLDGDCDAESGPGRWRGKAIEVVDILADELARGPLAASDANLRLEAVRLVARLAHHFGPTNLYLFSPRHLERELRDLRIRAEHDGTVDGLRGIDALSRQYCLSPAQIYAILRR